MKRAFVFPGQGSQFVGMGSGLADNFPVAKRVFEEVNDALGQDLFRLMREGPLEELTLTVNTQPALMAHSVAALRVLQEERGARFDETVALAGHSLGEYSALCASQAITLSDAARVLRIRGEAMQAAVSPGDGAMAALLGADLETVETALADRQFGGVCEIANDNAPGQIVVSGRKEAISNICDSAKELGAKMAKMLPVSAPFHCSLMQPAADRMEEALAEIKFEKPVATIYANVTAAPVHKPDDIRRRLVEQVTGRVRWTETIQNIRETGFDAYVEVGAGKVLSGLIRRIAKGAVTLNVGEPTDIDEFTS
ncbi:MAG: ACP S-malonyltransferase [Pseudomonadota bacterium]